MTTYDWVPFFRELCTQIDKLGTDETNREAQLYSKVERTFPPTHAFFRYKRIDPFSFIYALAQRNTINNRQRDFSAAKTAFNLAADLPTDWRFPTPMPVAPSLFYAAEGYVDGAGSEVGSECIWRLFHSILHDTTVNDEDFMHVLSIKNVGVVKLTQVLFLVNPEHYLPFDTQMNTLPIPSLHNLRLAVSVINAQGYPAYVKVIGEVKAHFPGCAMYEINLLNLLLNSGDERQLRISNRFFQVSSRVDGGSEKDYFSDFVTENAVWTGGPGSASGKTTYPLTSIVRGDVMLVRRGTVNLGGIAVVEENEYQNSGFTDEGMIRVVWLTKRDERIEDDRLGQWDGLSEATKKTIDCFRQEYPEAFAFVDRLLTPTPSPVPLTSALFRNLVLSGPPGTGKTRLAKHLALWLTSEEVKDQPIWKVIRQNTFEGDPDIEGNEYIELIQFHPSYTYEDFVRGITTRLVEGKVHYAVENKVLATIATKAAQPENRHHNYVLIIDEINRANLPSVLGELVYALEYRNQSVKGVYPYEGSRELVLPDNLYIIGTMNSADRSIGHMDYAVRRRFSFVQVPPTPTAIISPVARRLFDDIQLLFTKHRADEFRIEDVALGHSYFLGDEAMLPVRLDFEIRPILNEYIRDGILRQDAEEPVKALVCKTS